MLLRLVAGLRAGHRIRTMTTTTISSLTSLGITLMETPVQSDTSFRFSYSTSEHPIAPAGQPIHDTHPELVALHELTPGIPAAEYRFRRQYLASQLPPGGVAILPSAATTYMAGVIPWPYRQDPDFFYLTGLLQHGLAVIAAPPNGSSSSEPQFTLFIDAPNATRERWDGATISKGVAREVFGADEVLMMHEMPRRLRAIANSTSTQIMYDTDRVSSHHAATLAAVLKPALEASGRVTALRPLLHAMRMIKSPSEAAMMGASAAIASAAVRHCMAVTAPGVSEYGIAAAFEYGIKSAGAQRLAYPTMVAGGADSCTIHYGRNDKVLAPGQLVAMDAGAEYWGYVSDVTRTWPVGGTFSGPQRDVYELVLEVHQRCLAACRPGSSLRELHSLSVDLLSDGIRELKLLPGASATEIRNGLYREFFWHSLGHYLGLDTHDTPLIGHERKLAEGMVITVEPGLYIPDHPRYGPFRGIGVRIEDDVLVTAEGCRVLSDQAPVTVQEVEELAGSAAAAAQGAHSRPGFGGIGGARIFPAVGMPLPARSQALPHRRLAAAAREEAAGPVAVPETATAAG